ncbi:MAG: flagella accessory protein C [Thermoplasmatota archaeon]
MENQSSEEKVEESTTEEKSEGKLILKKSINKDTEESTESLSDSREEIGQRRDALQNFKDFDFQIKKNQDDINKISQKIDAITKDLDDLIGLYEIVSEQMNPFVGLSKVTKKRIDALENFTKEIEDIKIRMEDVESIVEQGIGNIKRAAKENCQKKPTTDDDNTDFSSMIDQNDTKIAIETPIETTKESMAVDQTDTIINKALENIIAEQKIDMVINDFLLSLK